MSDLLDGLGDIITDGDGSSIFDGSGASETTSVTVTTSPNEFVTRIQRDINAPDFEITPTLHDIVREFTMATWVLYRSYEVQGSGVEESTNASVSFDVSATVPGLIPIRVDKLRTSGSSYKPVMREIVGSATRTNYEVYGSKFYNFFASEEDGLETYVRIFPWDSDPLIYLSVAFRTVDEPTTFPSILLDYKEAICCGVMSRMMLQPNMDWFNPQLSAVHNSTYEKGVNKAKLRWFRENVSGVAKGKKFI